MRDTVSGLCRRAEDVQDSVRKLLRLLAPFTSQREFARLRAWLQDSITTREMESLSVMRGRQQVAFLEFAYRRWAMSRHDS